MRPHHTDDQQRNVDAWDETARDLTWDEHIREAIKASQDAGLRILMEDSNFFDRKVRETCGARLRPDRPPTLLEIQVALERIVTLEMARIKEGHWTADFNRLRAAYQVLTAVRLKLSREARERGAH